MSIFLATKFFVTNHVARGLATDFRNNNVRVFARDAFGLVAISNVVRVEFRNTSVYFYGFGESCRANNECGEIFHAANYLLFRSILQEQCGHSTGGALVQHSGTSFGFAKQFTSCAQPETLVMAKIQDLALFWGQLEHRIP